MSLAQLLAAAADTLAEAGVDSPRLDARLFLAAAMGISREQLIAVSREPTCLEAARFAAMIRRRAAREPVAYILGVKEFWSLDFRVGPGVLVPRPETETLIEAALKVLPDKNAPLAIADFGLGSAALLIAILREFPSACGRGFECSRQAMTYAETNLARHGLTQRARLVGAGWEQAPTGRFDAIFSNPPYIPTAELDRLEPEVRLFEPRLALDGGSDGLDAYRALSHLIPRALRPGGLAFLELGRDQEPMVKSLFRGLMVLHAAPDLAGTPRALVLKKPN